MVSQGRKRLLLYLDEASSHLGKSVQNTGAFVAARESSGMVFLEYW